MSATATWRGRLSQGIHLVLLLVSLGLSVYGVEILLALDTAWAASRRTLWGAATIRSVAEKDEIRRLARESGVEFDTRSRLEVILELRKKGIGAVATVPPAEAGITIGGSDVLPFGGISGAVTVFCNENGAYTIYESDERGLHNPRGAWSHGAVDIAALGDSYAHGACVPSARGFVGLLRQRHPGTLNLAYAGAGPMTMLAALKEYLPSEKPRLTLWFFYEENDFVDLLAERHNPILKRYLKSDFSQGLMDRQFEIDRELSGYLEKEMRLELASQAVPADPPKGQATLQGLLGILELEHLRHRLSVLGRGRLAVPEYGPHQMNLFRSVLSKAKTVTASWGGALYFVYLPARDRYARNREFNRGPILNLVRDVGLPVIDIHEAFRAHGDPLGLFPFRRFGHYNEEGQRVVATAVLRATDWIGPRRQ